MSRARTALSRMRISTRTALTRCRGTLAALLVPTTYATIGFGLTVAGLFTLHVWLGAAITYEGMLWVSVALVTGCILLGYGAGLSEAEDSA